MTFLSLTKVAMVTVLTGSLSACSLPDFKDLQPEAVTGPIAADIAAQDRRERRERREENRARNDVEDDDDRDVVQSQGFEVRPERDDAEDDRDGGQAANPVLDQ